jgi:DNA-binding XRE family transcriptional regulator
MPKNIINEITKKFSSIIKQTTKIIKQDAVYGIRLGKLKIKEMKLEQKKLEKLIEIGRKTYQLYKKGLIKEEELQKLCNQLSILEKSAKEYHTLGEEYLKNIKL